MSSIPAYYLGEPVRLSTTLTTIAGALTDANVALTIRLTDGTDSDQSANVFHDGTGLYHCDYTPANSGEYYFRWVASGALVTAAEGQFQVLRSEF